MLTDAPLAAHVRQVFHIATENLPTALGSVPYRDGDQAGDTHSHNVHIEIPFCKLLHLYVGERLKFYLDEVGI